jgi:DNA mismatch repair protein MSH6
MYLAQEKLKSNSRNLLLLFMDVKQLLPDLADAQAQREASLRGILQGLIRQFCEHHSIWNGIVNVVAEMDVLISLALASNYFVGPTCRPSIKDTSLGLHE